MASQEWLTVGIAPVPKGRAMWIETEGNPHKMLVNLSLLDTVYVSHPSAGLYKIVGTVGDRDLLLATRSTGSEAYGYVDELYKTLMA